MYVNVDSKFTHENNKKKLETMQKSIKSWIEKLCYIHMKEYFSSIKWSELHYGNGYTTVQLNIFVKTYWIVCLKLVIFLVCNLYLNKANVYRYIKYI